MVFLTLVLLLSFVAILPSATARGRSGNASDSVTVLAHLSLPGPPVRQIFLQEHRGKLYLYIQQASQQGFTIVDVTKAYRPKVVKRVTFPKDVAGERLQMVGAGLAIAQVSDSEKESASDELAPGKTEGALNRGARDGNPTQFVRLLDLSDPAHPRTLQTFDRVTSVLPEDRRNLIFLTNNEGLWILRHRRDLARQICNSETAFSEMANCNAY
jgi:hypothetical protein